MIFLLCEIGFSYIYTGLLSFLKVDLKKESKRFVTQKYSLDVTSIYLHLPEGTICNLCNKQVTRIKLALTLNKGLNLYYISKYSH